MIDLHTHTLLSDGELLPSELVRRAEVKGYKAIGITDHCDRSNIDFIVPRIVKVAKALSLYWKNIKVIPGVELTHVPLEEIAPLIKYARGEGAKIIVVHGETLSEPVLPGTNRMAIESGADILAHPGNISEEDAMRAAKNGVHLEITTRKNHSASNKHVAEMARKTGAKLILNTDTHKPEDITTKADAERVLGDAGLSQPEIEEVFRNSEIFAQRP
ncbi:MAG: histidinol phosphate phosphatase domain-containing protein [Candidatus Omnitrophica bacterium]|nr:histidinol phosphate phosphatase domain-containing protein [Candidatus Omnitrophota bacterium]MBU4488739.1 histidinol phosphate phosphatase domain-containing protein [Candidatus Omnitrophota bacterium]MCG2705836.1 histidinol phosphate phosphatase domain-containing protein [Candidatus Omnitrophota bacterium]